MTGMKALGSVKGVVAGVADVLLHLAYFAARPFEQKRAPGKILKILIVDNGFLGDSVISFPAVRSIRKAHPDALISVLINPKFRALWRDEKSYDELIDETGYFRLIKKIRAEKFDVAVDFRGDVRNILFFLYASGAPVRVGFGITGGGYLLTKNVAFPGKNEVENNLAVAEALGGGKEDYSFGVSEPDFRPAKDAVGNDGRKIVLVFPSAGYPTKEWDNVKWAQVCGALGKKYLVILSGVRGDKNIDEISRLSEIKPLSFFGSLNEISALMKLSYVVVGVDTGPMHLASASGARTVVLFGPADPVRWRPYKNSALVMKECLRRPCGLYRRCRREKNKCMSLINVEDVLKLVK